jgi:thioredoxin reductase (NADPH)
VLVWAICAAGAAQRLLQCSDKPTSRSATCVDQNRWTRDVDRYPSGGIEQAYERKITTSVYAASEGLSVLVLDCRSSGGQAGASARIENYLGFPTGISGMALMARAYNQAHKFGVETTIPSEVVGFDTPDANKPGRFVLRLASGDLVSARSIPSDAA